MPAKRKAPPKGAKGLAVRAYRNRRTIAKRVKTGASLAKKGVRTYRRMTGARKGKKKK